MNFNNLGDPRDYNLGYLDTRPISQGWECPKCKSIYSPTSIMCLKCPQNKSSFSIPTEFPPRPSEF